ncbi:MAG: tyrosine-protein phosphatase [Pirellulales bacterium]
MPVHLSSVGAVVCLVALLAAPGEARGGLDISLVAPGIYRGSAPKTSADYETLQRYGIRTVLDLRKYNPDEVACTRRALTARGIRHINVPMGFFPRRDHTVEQALSILADPAMHPVYLHCKLGQDRVGLVVGIYRVHYEGVSPAAAYAEMEEYGYHRVLVGLTKYFRLATPGNFRPSSASRPHRKVALSRRPRRVVR